MVHLSKVCCPYCNSSDLQKNGKRSTGAQQWHCKLCNKYFQRTYRYNACQVGIKDKVIEMTLNSSGVRDIGRVLSISKDTVVAILKKKRQQKLIPTL